MEFIALIYLAVVFVLLKGVTKNVDWRYVYLSSCYVYYRHAVHSIQNQIFSSRSIRMA